MSGYHLGLVRRLDSHKKSLSVLEPRGRDVRILSTSESQSPRRGIPEGLVIGVAGEGTWPSQVVAEQVN